MTVPTPFAGGDSATTGRLAATSELLSRLWRQNLPLLRERVRTLEHAASEAASGTLSPEGRIGAADLAHKLAGSLGMFGYPRGTEIAREMETLLEADATLDGSRFLQLARDLRAALPLDA